MPKLKKTEKEKALEEFIFNLDTERRRKRHSVHDLARRCGICEGTWYRKRKSPETFTLNELMRIVDFYGVQFNYKRG
ncbi:MAG: helix-turn-helix domain-containing protein [Ruminococcaceae bacterium]|nr:helix-turn-helix domain-containing protein [Oscillospiraceae bacterium]